MRSKKEIRILIKYSIVLYKCCIEIYSTSHKYVRFRLGFLNCFGLITEFSELLHITIVYIKHYE